MASEIAPNNRGQQIQQQQQLQLQPIQPLQSEANRNPPLPTMQSHLGEVPKSRVAGPMSRVPGPASLIVPTSRDQPTSVIVPTSRDQLPLTQTVAKALPTSAATRIIQPSTTKETHLGEVPPVKSRPTSAAPGILKAPPTAALATSSRSSQLMRGDRRNLMFSTSDDGGMMQQILATHVPDGREFDVKPLFLVIQDIMQRSNLPILGAGGAHESHAHIDGWDDKGIHSGYSSLLELLAYPINKTGNEIISRCSAGGDAHMITMAFLQSLSSYSWEAKVTIAFAAFAVNYGEFWLVAQLYTTNPLAKSIAALKELPEIMEHTEAFKKKFDAVNNLIKAMVDVTDCIIKFNELPSQYIVSESSEMVTAAAHIPTAVYWAVRCIVACASILNLLSLGDEYIASAAESWELNSLAHKLANIKEHLEKQMTYIYTKRLERRQNDAYLALIRLFETPHIDNMKILRALIYAKEDQLPLFDVTHKRRASLDILRRKHVLLLISDLDMSHEELSILHQMYNESKQQPTRPESQYEVIWIPVVDRSTPWNDAKQKQFELVQNSMPWYSVADPMIVDPAGLRFIKEVWRFTKKPQLVVLDPQGRESNRNALHMMWIWGSLAFPFTKSKEEALWREETWRIELLADSIDQNLFLWVNENRYICLYGGENIDWIRKFTAKTWAVANGARIPLEMLYVGKSNPKERVRRNNSIIQVENLSHVLPDLTLVWFFWVRLECMWHSKVQHGMTVENDPIMQEIVTMLSFDGSNQGWAVFSRGSHEMAKGKGETILECLNQYDGWKDKVVCHDGFVIAMNEQLRELHSPHHCNRHISPGTTGLIPERVVCVECNNPMEMFIMYRCCNQ